MGPISEEERQINTGMKPKYYLTDSKVRFKKKKRMTLESMLSEKG